MAFSLKKRALAVLTAFAMAFSLFAGASAAYADEAGAVGGAASADRDAFRDAIAATFVDSADTWTVMDMAAYAAIDGTTVATSDEARQGALNALVTMAANGSSSLSNRAAVEIVARSIGVDSTQLYQVNATEPIDNAAALAASDVTAEGYYTAPYILLAADQGNLALSDGQVASLLDVIEGGMGDGLFGYEWDGITYTSPDTSGIVLSALASRVDSDPQAQRIVDTILAALPTAQGDDGSFGSANTDAFVIIGLLAVGEDPFAMTSDSGASVVDGLMSYANVETASFQYAGEDNALATEQGFRALVALSLATVGTPFNVYDFSATQVAPGRATGEGAVDPAPEPGTGDPIEVAVSIKAGDDAWVEGAQVQVAGGSMVYHALMQAIEDAGIEQTGAESGYISSMTYNGVTLEEFGDGPNSGWLYTLNGVRPEVSITGQVLADGDAIVLFYTDDWTALDTPPFPDIGSSVVWPFWVFVYAKPAGSPFTEAPSELTTQLDSLS